MIHFSRPFYRIAHLILVPKMKNNTVLRYKNALEAEEKYTFGPVFEKKFLIDALRLQLHMQNFNVTSKSGQTIYLNSTCYKPLEPDNNHCAIMSLFQYHQNNLTYLLQEPLYPSQYLECMQAPLTQQTKSFHRTCMAQFGGPIDPYMVLGAFPTHEGVPDYAKAQALIITITIRNHQQGEQLENALLWEKQFLKYMENYRSKWFDVKYRAERSIEDEIERESRSDIKTVLISYLIMFLYIAIALGRIRNFRHLLVDMKVSLGIAGVALVILSVWASVGIFSYMRIPTTLIIFEVIPFLVLAVGVDNIFILTQTIQRDEQRDGEDVEQQIGRIVGRVGPAMLLTSVSESIAFFLGALTPMPAVRLFSLYAAVSVLIDFLLQITVFVTFITLDHKRMIENRIDVCCCLQIKRDHKKRREGTHRLRLPRFSWFTHETSDETKTDPTLPDNNNPAQTPLTETKSNETQASLIHQLSKIEPCEEHLMKMDGFLFKIFKKYYAPLIMNRHVRPAVIFIFITWLASSMALLPYVKVGLEQTITMPKDSYMIDYFSALKEYFAVGPPVYFVIKPGKKTNT